MLALLCRPAEALTLTLPLTLLSHPDPNLNLNPDPKLAGPRRALEGLPSTVRARVYRCVPRDRAGGRGDYFTCACL